ncbi:LutB/LldF family L-lactate oxidation iron-sulfur protein [Candidatus Leptofilum sp.]|uniref:LutB/LldF family L-lactate oxidation iron-sulfur protein n=1 Tax=Candidatus Leptofilum sp. TaxID=3241576 RepID=UPI003B5BA865
MKVQSAQFIPAAQIAIHDPDLQTAVAFGTNTGFTKRQAAMFADGEAHGQAMRQQAAAIKRHALNNLPDLLAQAEANMQANGIQVLWALDAAEANRHMLEIAQRHNVRSVVKSKSMVTEEIGLNHALETAAIEVLETDLGEYIVQLGGDTPSHIVVPIIHKTKESIRDLLIEKANMPPTDGTEAMALFARETLRQRFLMADMGVSGGNFIIAETGSLCLVSNEGNARLVTSLPRVHVALVGIEKLVATVEDYATLTQVLPRSATGQALTVYTHIVNGPRQPDEPDGPEQVYVILVDNGRSDIYTSDYCEALACIRCGACLNGCPVYQVTGGHAYGWVYPGPIGAVITPLLTGLENASPLPHASTLCGMCKQVCPVDIDIPHMLLNLRHELVARGQSSPVWDIGMKAWALGNKSPGRFVWGGKVAAKVTNLLKPKSLPVPLAGWTKHRTPPKFAPKSFHQLWRERQGDNDEQS